jgi:hypothetical protein
MNKPARMLLWIGGTVAISLLAAVLIDPAVLVVIGVAMTTAKQIDMDE